MKTILQQLKDEYRAKLEYMIAQEPYANLTPANKSIYKTLQKEVNALAVAILRQEDIYKRIGMTAVRQPDGFSYKIIGNKKSRFAY